MVVLDTLVTVGVAEAGKAEHGHTAPPTVTLRLVAGDWMLPLSSTARARMVAVPLTVGVQV